MLSIIEFPGPIEVLFHSYTAILFTVFQRTSIHDLKDGYDPSLNRCHDLQVPQLHKDCNGRLREFYNMQGQVFYFLLFNY